MIYTEGKYEEENNLIFKKFDLAGMEKLQVLNVSSSLQNWLFNRNSGYKIADNPMTRVGLRLHISRLDKFDEITGELQILSSVLIFWADVRLTWDPESFSVFLELGGYSINVDFLQVKLKDIWRPDISLFNPFNELNVFRELQDEKVLLDPEGLLSYEGLLKTNTYCKPNLKQFPFDEHECTIQFVATSTVITNIPQKPEVFDENAKWIYFEMEPCVLNLAPSRYGLEVNRDRRVLVFPFKVIRRPSYLFVNIAVPLLVLSLLNTVVFFIPAIPGERLSFCISLLLAFTVYLIYVAGLIPETSNPVPLIIYFLVSQFLLSAFITCSSFFTAVFFQREGTKAIPRVITEILKRFHKIRVNDVENGNLPKEHTMEENTEEQSIPDDETLRTGEVSYQISWKSIAMLVDRVCLTLTCIILLLEVVLFSYLASRLSTSVEPNPVADICRGFQLNMTKFCFDDVSGLCVDPTMVGS
ncbi:acetylcholine receptor subunit alpha-1-A-like [Saccostrea echinata]|uniref:acetylcholine receptor subunit alpha-1-A-like n=1 Tax=Saccostrea echinata TaxID=191078 RepID=UPI002A8058E4|nr:acetylcholine receptor subunit alpha-1-A-like [Saccostrea echinata]